MVVDTKSGIKFIYKGKTTGKEVECYLETEDLNNILNQNLTEEESDKHKFNQCLLSDGCR